MNREERIAAARFFVWEGERIEASTQLYVGLLDAHRRISGGEALEVPVAVGKTVKVLTQTPVEDLLDLCQASQLEMAKARGSA